MWGSMGGGREPLGTNRHSTLRHTRCTVWLDGLLVIDNWEGAASASSNSSTASPSLPKLSGCITIPAGAAPSVISVAFSGANLTAAKLQLSWSVGCSGSGGPPPVASAPPPPPLPAAAAAFSSLAGSVSTTTAWLPDAYTAGGWVAPLAAWCTHSG